MRTRKALSGVQTWPAIFARPAVRRERASASVMPRFLASWRAAAAISSSVASSRFGVGLPVIGPAGLAGVRLGSPARGPAGRIGVTARTGRAIETAGMTDCTKEGGTAGGETVVGSVLPPVDPASADRTSAWRASMRCFDSGPAGRAVSGTVIPVLVTVTGVATGVPPMTGAPAGAEERPPFATAVPG